MTRSDKWRNPPRPVVAAYWAFKDEITLAARQQKFVLADQYQAKIYVEMPKSWSKKKRDAMNGQKHKQRPDWDNFAKAFQDCLSAEDSGVWCACVQKRWAEKPGLEIKNLPENFDF
jgi:Holliday junction resolvase RusA-like endonuclease